MPNYLVQFSFAYPESSFRDESSMYGVGSIPIQTDKKPETEEELLEIARTIGMQGGYAQVAINKLTETETFVDDSLEVLEGIIVDEN